MKSSGLSGFGAAEYRRLDNISCRVLEKLKLVKVGFAIYLMFDVFQGGLDI